MGLQWRHTNDLDLIVSIALEDYPAGLQDLPGWHRRHSGDHAWRSVAGVNVDIIPAGPSLLQSGALTWPDGYRMSLVGLRLAFEHHTQIAVGEQHSVAIATVPVIVVLKMVAFLDRPAQREDDLTDIAHALEEYLGAVDDRRWQLPTDFENAPSFALGADIGAMLNEQERQVVTEFVGKAKDENDRHRTHALLVRNGPMLWRQHPEVVLERLGAFEKALAAAHR